MVKWSVWAGRLRGRGRGGLSTAGHREAKGMWAGAPPWHLCPPSPGASLAGPCRTPALQECLGSPGIGSLSSNCKQGISTVNFNTLLQRPLWGRRHRAGGQSPPLQPQHLGAGGDEAKVCSLTSVLHAQEGHVQPLLGKRTDVVSGIAGRGRDLSAAARQRPSPFPMCPQLKLEAWRGGDRGPEE